MKIKTHNITEYIITDVEGLDPIMFTIHDGGEKGFGISIMCCLNTWRHFGGSHGESTVAEFILENDNDYLATKLNSNTPYKIPVRDKIEGLLKATVLELRRELEIDRESARSLYNGAKGGINPQHDYWADRWLCDKLGFNWEDELPWIINPDYLYFDRILNAVKEALKKMRENNEI